MTAKTPGFTPVLISVNVDVEEVDASNAGSAALFGRHSYGRYGLREGIWRLLEVFGEEGVRATFFGIPDEVERYERVFGRLIDDRHEVGTRGRVAVDDGPDATRERLAREREQMLRVLGGVNGWRAVDGIVNPFTLPSLAQLGYRYDSSAVDDDDPYVMGESGTASLTELPIVDYLSDAAFYAQRHTDARVEKAWAEEARSRHAEGSYLHLVLHSRGDVGSVRLPRIAVVRRWIRNVKQMSATRFVTASEAVAACAGMRTAPEPFPTRHEPRIGR